MTVTRLKRQFIRDAEGNPVGVILPMEEYVRIAPLIERPPVVEGEAAALEQMAYAAQDPLFLADLRETMTVYEVADAEWWEPTE